MGLVKNHPRCSEKIGSGIRLIRLTKKIVRYKGREIPKVEMVLQRTDGSSTDISWRKCSGVPSATVKDRLKQAMRVAIEEQITAFRHTAAAGDDASSAGLGHCEVCKKLLNDGPGHVDHHNPCFAQLAASFMRSTELSSPTSFTETGTDELNRSTFCADDMTFAAEWQEYHRKHAKLRLLCAHCNLTAPKPHLLLSD